MSVEVVLETHSTTEDNALEEPVDRPFAWQPGWEYF
jgi:hypothetical protein